MGTEGIAHYLLIMTSIDPARPYLLAIETSGHYGSIGLGNVKAEDSTEVVGTLELNQSERSARTLAPAIQKLLADYNVESRHIGAIAVTSGPGSFTGLRVGITTAKTMAYVLNTKLFAINTLEVISNNYRDETSTVWCLIDAQRKEWFSFKQEPNLTAQVQSTRLTHGEICEALADGDIIAGPEVMKLAGRIGDKSNLYHWQEESVSAESLVKIGMSQWLSSNDCTRDPFQLVPAYHRPSAAEENYDRQQAKR